MKTGVETAGKGNPLLSMAELPTFSDVKAEHVMSAIDYLLEANQKTLAQVLEENANNQNPKFEDIFIPLEEMEERLNQAWNVISHLNAVKNTPKLYEAYEKALLKISEYETKLNQNEGLYKLILAVSKQTQHKLIENALKDFKLSGINLEKKEKELFKKLNNQLSALEGQFEQNLLESTDAWNLHIKEEDKARLKGIPEMALEEAHNRAKDKKLSGWLLTLDYPAYHAVMTYAEDRTLRKTLYEAYVTRASELGGETSHDNGPIMVEILKLRQQLADLLNFKHYAELALVKRIAKTPEEVLHFLEGLSQPVKERASREVEELRWFAKESHNLDSLESWDIAYYSEKLLQQKFGISEEALRQYFPVDKVLKGFFEIVGELFGIKIKEIYQFDKWTEQTRLFEVYGSDNQLSGRFYLDLFARPNKRGGGWVSDYRERFNKKAFQKFSQTGEDNAIQTPITFLTTNFSLPSENAPALLTHDEVITLFHEFGHCLHHVLSKVDYPSISGTSGVELDGIEFPSQFMENWCWEKDSLKRISSHFKTGEPLPDPLIEKMNAAKNFQSGMQMARQLEFGLFDFKIHMQSDIKSITTTSIQQTLDQIRSQISVIPTPKFNRFQNGFYHSFDGDYAAGYYSYLWAEVLSCDAFLKFKEEGIFNPVTGKEFLEGVLAEGGKKSMMDLFEAFRGRKPNNVAFLRYYGLGNQS